MTNRAGSHTKSWLSLLAGESEEKLGGGRTLKTCPSLDLVRKTIQSRRTCLAKPAYHRRGGSQGSDPSAIRPGRVAHCEPSLARRWDHQSRSDRQDDSSHLPAVPHLLRQNP